MIKRFFYASQGNILALFALCLPIILMLTALVIDGGRMLVTKARMQNTIDAAAAAGASVISDEIVNIVQIKKEANPELEIPDDITELLNNDDRNTLLDLDEVRETIHTYLAVNNTISLDDNELTIDYPFDFSIGDPTIGIQITWRVPANLQFTEITQTENTFIEAETLSTVRITP